MLPRQGQTEVSIGGSLAGWELVIILAGVGAVLVVLAWPLLRSFSRRVETSRLAAAYQANIDLLVAELQLQEARLNTLEDRVDQLDLIKQHLPPG